MPMDEILLNAFAQSINNVFQTMLMIDVMVDEPFEISKEEDSRHSVSGIIGLSGDVKGAIALCFDTEMAKHVVKAFTGTECEPRDPDFGDAIGELANMVAGSAKSNFDDLDVSLSCPSVVIGEGHQLHQQSQSPAVRIPCSCDGGSFAIEVSLDRQVGGEQAGAA